MTQKVILCASLVAVSSLLGLHYSQKLTLRTKCLEQSIWMVQKIEACLCYEKMSTASVIQFLSTASGVEQLEFLSLCQQYMQQGKIFPNAWRQAITEVEKRHIYQNEDLQTLAMLGDLLGSSDANSQLGELALMRRLLEQGYENAKQTQQQKGKLYRCLGVLLGIGLAILAF